LEKKKRKISFKPAERLEFPCYKYRWQLFYRDRYFNDKEFILASAPRLKDIKEYILRELSDWDCFIMEVRLRLYALCKKKGTGEVFKVRYEIICNDEEEKKYL